MCKSSWSERELTKSITSAYVARASVDAIIYAMDHSSTASRDISAQKEKVRLDPLLIFASNVAHRSEVGIPAILVSGMYRESHGTLLRPVLRMSL